MKQIKNLDKLKKTISDLKAKNREEMTREIATDIIRLEDRINLVLRGKRLYRKYNPNLSERLKRKIRSMHR
jgi:hypothetical protein